MSEIITVIISESQAGNAVRKIQPLLSISRETVFREV